jgi:hypothetical protein
VDSISWIEADGLPLGHFQVFVVFQDEKELELRADMIEAEPEVRDDSTDDQEK